MLPAGSMGYLSPWVGRNYPEEKGNAGKKDNSSWVF
jgi:hypothetical protein